MAAFTHLPLCEAHKAKGAVVVIDVLRAFTTAAYAFSRGAKRIYPVSTVAEALSLKKEIPGSLIMGEQNGIKPPGFDFGNSPAEIIRQDFSNKVLIQRTSAGTQGLVRSTMHHTLIAASFVVARATAEYIKQKRFDFISFVITGESLGRDGDEDLACAEYIQELIQCNTVHSESYTARILQSTVGRSFLEGKKSYLSKEDLSMSARADIFDFILLLNCEDNLLTMNNFEFTRHKNMK